MAQPTTTTDIPLHITSETSRSERRITPSWSVAQFKARLEPITGVPASCQKLKLKVGSQPPVAIEAADEEAARLEGWGLQAYAEVEVTDTRPPSARPNYTDPSAVPKYELPTDSYEALPGTVRAYKKAHQIGRFDPAAPTIEQSRIATSYREASERHIEVGKRCRLLPAETDDRRGEVRFVGEVEGLPGVGAWVGVECDEPVGRNDGVVGGVRVFDCGAKRGVFVRAERVEVGEFPVVDELADEEEF